MIEIKTFDGSLNLDDSQYRLPKGDYIDALNITKDAVEGSNDLVVSNVIANRIGDANFTLPSGRNVCIGSYSNTLRGTIIQCIWNENDYHLILEFDTRLRVQTTILANLTDTANIDILGFTEFGKITGINVYNRDEGDLLIFLDSLGRPTYLDITAFKAGTYTPVTREIIDLATRPPLAPPSGVYGNDTAQTVNYLVNKFFRFKTLWTNFDLRSTTTSPISEVLIPVGILSDSFTSVQTNNNVITLSLSSGDKDVKYVTLLMSYVEKTNEWSDFLIVETINKSKQSIADNITFSYPFYNDSTYPAYDIEKSIQIFDYVPLYANAQASANGNVVVFGGITEGYDNDLVANVVNVVSYYAISSPTGGNLAVSNSSGFGGFGSDYFSGTPAIGTTIEITLVRASDSAVVRVAFYTTIAGDTTYQVTLGLAASFATYGALSLYGSVGTSVLNYTWDDGVYTSMSNVCTVTAPTSALSSNSIPVWKWSSQRNIGMAYFDGKGRTNGIIYNAKIIFPKYEDDASGNVFLPQILTSVYHIPPIWAESFQFLFSKDDTYFLFWATNSVILGNTGSDTEYIFLEVTDFVTNAAKFPTTATNLSYTFQDGDRMRLIKPLGLTTYFGDQYNAGILGLLVDPQINGVTQTGKQFLKIKKSTTFSDALFTPNNQTYEIEIYRPTQQSANLENKVYYECGRQYSILNPHTAIRVHQGETQNQSTDYATPAVFLFTKGSSYYRQRIIALDSSNTILFNVQDLNITDNYISAVNSIDGRPNIIDINAKQAYYSTLVRFGQAYQPNTNINGLNRFSPANFDEYDNSFGDIHAFIIKNRNMVVCQRDKIGVVGIFNKISKNPDGTQLLVVTDKLLNPIDYYVGDFGIGTAPESLASFNYAVYGCDNIRGIIWRLSNDGLKPLSIMYKVNSWASQELPLRQGEKKIIGTFDQRLNNYIIALNGVPCLGVEVPDFTLDGANTGEAFSQTVVLVGSVGFSLENVTKPSWMTIQIDGFNLVFSGTPSFSDAGTGIPVTFDITNDCGLANVDKTIDVTAVACVAVGVSGTPLLPDGTIGVAYNYNFGLTGTAPFSLTSIVKPSWMTISVVGSTIYFSGTPDTSGTGITVSFTINNCASDTYNFSDTINVSAVTNCIFLSHQNETIGGSIFMKGTSLYAVASIVTVNFTITTTDDSYTNNVIIQIGQTVSPLVKIEYTSGNPSEAFVSQTINTITPSSDSTYTYNDCS